MNIKEFYKKRLIKLTVPSWIFLTLYFSLIYAAFFSFGNAADYPYSLRTVLKSYMYGGGGIDYLWILRVYIFIAILTPFALRLKASNNPSKLSTYFLILFFGYLVYELLISLTHLVLPVPISKSIDANLFTLLAYSLLFLYGLRLDELKKSKVLIIAGLSIIPFVAIVIYNFVTFDMFYQTQVDKYPPRLYYLSYAFCCLHIVYLLCDKLLVKIIPVKIITWLSANSLWVYLWHIMGLFIAEWLLGSTNKELLPSLTKACFILWFGITTTLLQNYLVNRYLKSSQYVAMRRLANLLS